MKTIIAAGLVLLSASAGLADEAPVAEGTLHANLAGPSHVAKQDGEGIYNSVCAACHMPNAKGGTGAGHYPALAANDKLAASAYPVTLVMNGSKGMPSFKGMMSDAQIAAVVTYVRTHFGNGYADPVTLEEVKQVRETQ